MTVAHRVSPGKKVHIRVESAVGAAQSRGMIFSLMEWPGNRTSEIRAELQLVSHPGNSAPAASDQLLIANCSQLPIC